MKRANPALRDADRVLEILRDQRDSLAQLAADSAEVTEPLAREKAHVAGFLSNAGASGQATAERGADLEASLQRFPEFLRQFRTTMRTLQGFSDAASPVFSDLDRATPALTEATRNLAPFTAASTVALKSLGNAGQAAGPTFAAADPVVKKARNLARSGASPTTKLAKFLVNTEETGGWEDLTELIYNSSASTNEFDQFGHFIRSLVVIQNCPDYVTVGVSGCSANFTGPGARSSVAFDPAAMMQQDPGRAGRRIRRDRIQRDRPEHLPQPVRPRRTDA